MARETTYERIDVWVHRETAKALLVSYDQEDEGVWLPKSQIDYSGPVTVHHRLQIEVPDWLMKDKGL